MKKGISLPIEMIVIIAIAVLVLVVIAAFFVGGTSPLQRTAIDQAFSGLCAQQITVCGASPATISVSGIYDIDPADGTLDPTTTLARVCVLKGIISDSACRRACGCSS
jgi:hypothetical protein